MKSEQRPLSKAVCVSTEEKENMQETTEATENMNI